jgi:hypothetical protein
MLVECLAVEANDAIASGFFRDVQRVVGSFDERITIPNPRVRPCRDATAHRPL